MGWTTERFGFDSTQGLFFTALSSAELWGPPGLLVTGYRGIFPRGKMIGRGDHETDHSLLCRAGVKNESAVPSLHRSRWPRGLRSLQHWDRGFESHSRHECLCEFILCLCCSLCRLRPCVGLITRLRSPTVCAKKNTKLKKRPRPNKGL
jgi:hypothetical protein